MNSVYIALLLVKRIFGRGKRVLGFIVLPALAVSLAITVLAGYEASEIELEVLNRDRGGLGQVLADEWDAHPEFRVHMAASRTEGEEQVIRQLAEAVILIPETFTEDMAAGRTPQLEMNQLRYDEALYLAKNMVQAELGQMAATAGRLREAGTAGPEAVADGIRSVYRDKSERGAGFRVEFRSNLTVQRVTTSTGLLLMFIMILVMGTVSVVQEDRRSRTLERMYGSPLRPRELILGHFLGCFLAGTIQILFVLAVARLMMGTDFGMAFLSQWLVLECFLLAALGIAAAVASVAGEGGHTGAFYSLVMTPTCMLGGCFWPLEIMPEPMRKLANFVPQKWVIEAVARLSGGAGLKDIPYHLGILLLFAAILLSFGAAIVSPDRGRGL